jgi:multicomponent Na+:H+ antiporter subunit E
MAFVLWLLLSGHYDNVLLWTCGVLSTLLVVWIALRMDVADHDVRPLRFTWRALRYWPWLALQVVLSNFTVARHILRPRLRITPTLIRVKAEQKTEMGRVTYANSITLTPGTVTIDIQADDVLVHALTREAARELQEGEMNRRVAHLERLP